VFMPEDMRVSRREGSVTFSYIAPSPSLRHFIRDYLIAHFGFDQQAPVPHKPYAPKPEQGITFFVRGRPSMADPISGNVHKAPPASLFGQQVKRCDVHLPPEFLMFRVHFRPGALFRMLNFPIYDLGEDYYDAELVLGTDVREVSERLALARSYADMIDRAEAFLLGAVRKARQDVHPVDRVASYLEDDFRQPPADWLARQACLSPRQFNRKFTERLGVGPKLYSRLIRFHRAHRLKAARPAVGWPTVALECGYTDYQHLVRDFKEFTGATPNVWVREERASPENVLPRSSPVVSTVARFE
jgi:AraC-like DNA-binding protein